MIEKGCPFCGGIGRVKIVNGKEKTALLKYRVICESYGAAGPAFQMKIIDDSKLAATIAWNERK